MGKKKSNRIPVLFLAEKKSTLSRTKEVLWSQPVSVVINTHAKPVSIIGALPSPPSLASLASHHPSPPFSSSPTQLHTPCLSNFYPFEVHHTLSICGRCFTLCITSIVQFLKSFCSLIQKHLFLLTTSLVTGTLLGAGFEKINRT